MKTSHKKHTLISIIALLSISAFSKDTDPLPSWKNGLNKTAIIKFVNAVTSSNSTHFVPQPERIAAFDNDGTLWGEQPMYVQLAFILDRIKELAPQHPEWKTTQPFQAVLENDIKTIASSGEKGLMQLLMTTHANMTSEDFSTTVAQWLATAKHPSTGMYYTEMVYQPMLELIHYLQENEFKVFIVSGGGIEFMRPWTEKIYGIPPEQVIGSSIQMQFEIQDGKPVLMRLPKINFVDDKKGKPVGIQQHIGRRPIFTFGNSDGDQQMLQWVTAGDGLRFGGIVHHTDAKREFAYDTDTYFGKLKEVLPLAKKQGWIVIDMQKEWKTIYP